MFYPFESQVTPLTNVRRERMLPAPGNVVVSVGDRVDANQVVARVDIPSDFRIVPVARLLDIPASQIKKRLRVSLGDRVHNGQVIAKQRGFLGRAARSPINGTVTAVGGGRLLIEAQPTPVELSAYISGTVSNVIRDHGVVVETTGAVVQGVWGAGGENVGVLQALVRGPDEPLQGRMINPAANGTILIGGATLDEQCIERAQEIEVHGIITGGLPPKLLPLVRDLPFPIVVTEGIGEVPMSQPVFELLTANEEREASISGQVGTRNGGKRPEIVIPMPAAEIPTDQTQVGTPLTVGTEVRVVRAPYMGAVGEVTALPKYARRIATGARVDCAAVDLGEDEPVFVPLVNLEVLR